MNLLISLATRGRPAQVLDTVRRSAANWTAPGTRLVIQADADDAATLAHLSANPLPAGVSVNAQPREDTIAAKWNRILAQPADVYMSAADDDPYVTPGYDAKILDAAARFPDGIGIVYGHMANASFTGIAAPTAKLCEKLGWIFPPLFPYWFVDHWVDDIARMIGRISFADIRTDQSRAGHTQEMREPGWWATWFDAAYLMRRAQARAIIGAKDFKSPPWLKSLLLAHHPMIEFRSRWVNENVRRDERLRHASLPVADPRYQRVKAAAIALIPHLLEDYGMEVAEAAMFRNALAPPTEVVNLRRAFA